MTSAAQTDRGWRLVLRALRSRNYRLFFGGQTISLIGSFLAQVATSWLVYRLTGNAWWLGVVGFLGQLPMFVLAPFAGVWIDRWNRHRLLVITQVLAMVQSLALAALAYSPYANVWAILALAIFQGLINAFDMPARQAFVVEMVEDRSDLANAIALNSMMVHLARLIGPAAAGLLIAWVGEATCFLLDGLSYGAVIAALLAMRIQPRAGNQRPRRTVIQEMREGIRYVWRFVPIRAILGLLALVSFTAMPAFHVLLPIYGDTLSGREAGARTMGFLMAGSGLGALVGAVYLASRRTVVGLGTVISIAGGILGSSLIALALTRQLWISFLIVPFTGFGMITNIASANTLVQTLSDEDKRGRVMSFFTMAFMGMVPFGSLAVGALAEQLGTGIVGASRVMLIAGAVVMAGAALFAIELPSLRQIVRPIYVQKGILPSIAQGIQQSADVTEGAER